MKQLLWVVVLFICVGSASANASSGDRVAPAAPGVVPGDQPSAAGHRWVADASLRTGMQRVRRASDALDHLQHGHLDAGQVRALASEIDASVEFMFANCRLDPEPDAALHGLLARLLAASGALRDKPDDAAPVAEVRAVLAGYRQQFDDGEPARPRR